MSRTSLIRKNIVASFFIKGWSAAIIFLMVPLTLRMLGDYANGVWLTISSMMMWIDMLDIGLGNGLRNAVAEFMARGEMQKARMAISSTLFMLFIITIPVILVAFFLVFYCNIYQLLGVDPLQIENLKTIVMVAVIFVSQSFVFKTIGNIYMGLQLPAVSNLLMVIGQTIALVATYLAYIIGSKSLLVIVIINTLAPLAVWLSAYPFTFLLRYKQLCPSLRYIRLSMAKNMCTIGVKFFVLQICGVILFMSANVIISRLFSPAEVTPYQIAYRYYTLVLIVFTIVCMPFWNATTDAYTKGDMAWIKRASHKMNIMIAGLMVMIVLMTFAAEFIYSHWVGCDVNIPLSLSAAMATYMFVIILSQRYSYFLNGIGILHIQIVFAMTAAIIFIPLAIFVCKKYPTVTSLVWVMCIVNIPGLVANMWKFNRVITENCNVSESIKN